MHPPILFDCLLCSYPKTYKQYSRNIVWDYIPVHITSLCEKFIINSLYEDYLLHETILGNAVYLSMKQTEMINDQLSLRKLLFIHRARLTSPVISICPLHTNSGCGKERRIFMVLGDLPRQHPFRTTLRLTGPVLADSRQ